MTEDDKKVLLNIARLSIQHGLDHQYPGNISPKVINTLVIFLPKITLQHYNKQPPVLSPYNLTVNSGAALVASMPIKP